MKNLTEKQRKVLEFISEYIKANNYAPTMREIAVYFSFSPRAAYDFVNALKKKAYISRQNHRSRAIKIIKPLHVQDEPFVEVPVMGDVAAGRRVLTEENLSGTVPIHRSLIGTAKPCFALIVRGDSMIGAGIMDGDVAVVIKQETAGNGDIVVAEIDDGYTLKRYFRENSRIRLQPENPDYPVIYSRNVRIAGKLACIYRSY